MNSLRKIFTVCSQQIKTLQHWFKLAKYQWLSFILILAYSNYAAADEAYGLGDISRNLVGLIAGLNSIARTLFIALGAGLVCGAVLQYRAHRNNPSQVRLIQPIFLLLCGLSMLVLPFLTEQSDGGKILVQPTFTTNTR